MCHLRTPRHGPLRVAGTFRANPVHTSSQLQGLPPEVGSRLQPTQTCPPSPSSPDPRRYLRSRENPPRPLRSLAQSLRPEAPPPKQPISARPLRARPNDQKGRGRRGGARREVARTGHARARWRPRAGLPASLGPQGVRRGAGEVGGRGHPWGSSGLLSRQTLV